MTPPRPPVGLGAKARRLWRDVVETYELRVDELRLLEDTCRTVDVVERIDAALRGAELVVIGSTGQERPNPLLGELRGHRLVLARLLRDLGLPDDPGGAATGEQTPTAVAAASGGTVSVASVRARRAARARWDRGRNG